ncbi:hypothetical protein Zm00014a_031651 [Zea mays]|uniref:Uncharacterized protein n=1 Tax=Zea mays TaxID=4577 RepID=A0A3L6DNY6_MAIZE|nr:hypothetical protein Zm00014a_031651 [Zea mays]
METQPTSTRSTRVPKSRTWNPTTTRSPSWPLHKDQVGWA